MQKRQRDQWNKEYFRYMDEEGYAKDVPKGVHVEQMDPFLTKEQMNTIFE
jgi:hypothetical protein